MNTAVEILAADAEAARASLNADSSQTNRRTYVRALFAWYEALAYTYRSHAVEINEIKARRGLPVDEDIGILLREELPKIGTNGKVSSTKHKVPFTDHFAFSLRVMFDLVPFNEDIFKEDGWSHLKSSVRLRDRITHPKVVADVEISDKDLAECDMAYSWLAKLITQRLPAEQRAFMERHR